MSKVSHDYKIEGSKLVVVVAVDPNEDGQPVVKNTTEVDILQIPLEVMSAMSKMHSDGKA